MPDVPAVNDATRMLPRGQEFHQPIRAVTSVQRKGRPREQTSGYKSEKNARNLRDTGHEEDDEGKEDSSQSPDEEEKIL